MRITLVTDKGEVIDVIEMKSYDLNKPLHRAAILSVIADAAKYDELQQFREEAAEHERLQQSKEQNVEQE